MWVKVEVEDKVATICFDRPPVNALEPESREEIAEAFLAQARDPGVRAIVFCTGGERAFIAGADIKAQSANYALPPSDQLDSGLRSRRAMQAIYESPVPVVAAIQAPVIGGGFAYASLCDFIVATPNATFSAPEIDRGLMGASAHVTRALGPYRARRMFLLGETLSADELMALGVICEVVPREDLMNVARSYALRLAEKSPVAMRLAKEAMVRIEYMPVLEGYRIEQDYTKRLQSHPDSGEAQRAWAERRSPQWSWDADK